VLLDHEQHLIDGLRRIQAIESLGHDKVESVAVTLHPPAMAWIKRAREHGVAARPLTIRRMWELYRDTRPMIDKTRSQITRGRPYGRGTIINGRGGFLDAIGIDSESYLQAVTQFFRTAEEDSLKGSYAREVLAQVEDESMSVYMGLAHIRQRMARRDIVKAPDQERVLRTTVSTLNGLRYGMEQLGALNPELDRELLKDIANDMRRFRRDLTRLISQLEKEQDTSE
jgi:hypothetical protein